MSEAETKVELTPKQYKRLMDQLGKLETQDLLDVSRDVTLEPREKLLIYGVNIGIRLSGMNKRAWGVAFATSCLSVAVLFLVLGMFMY